MHKDIRRIDAFRIPDYPDADLVMDGAPLSVLNTATSLHLDPIRISAALGIATVLYNWCPISLAAFLDFDAWFSFTWMVVLNAGEEDEVIIEIGRVKEQITFGSLKKGGDNWSLMLTFNVALTGAARGRWVPNTRESMRGEKDITDAQEVNQLATEFVQELIISKRWETGKKTHHKLFIEYAPMEDAFDDGIPMSPHWLYEALDLGKCTTCGAESSQDRGESKPKRCGRCGTAAYCSTACQRRDWAVHKGVCNMSAEERGQALKVSQQGGLIGWDVEKTMVPFGCNQESQNPNFAKQQLRRIRPI